MSPLWSFILFFLIGAVFGSFANVLIYRLPRKLNFVSERSACPHCGKLIAFYDNIPLLSYLFLKGRCRQCQEPISLKYPLVEFGAGLLFVLAFLRFGFSAELFFVIIFGFFLLVLTVIDLEEMIVLDGLLIILAISGLTRLFFHHQLLWWDAGLGLIIGLAFFALVAFFGKVIFKRDAMGGGDIKLAAVLGLWLGWKLMLLNLALTFILAGVLMLLFLAAGIIRRGEETPFVPYMALGALISLLYGETLLEFYLAYIGY
ncbi:MAG TPA: prepilin peptidase [Candidatus Marinimicrobia bacterium]|nr:prepilin peptidase [Candidatus Neomarinimicrobiota bacterium]